MKHKRQFQDADSENTSAEEKRHRTSLRSVVLDAVMASTVQKLWVELEPMLRQVVREEVERAIAKYLPPTKLGSRLPSEPLEHLEPTSLRLQFQNKLALPLYAGCKVEGEHGSLIGVSLQDATTGEVVILNDESAVKLDIVVLEGDFPDNEEEDWTYEEFENYLVKERAGKPPLLTGDLSISLKEGMGTLGEVIFTDNSSWVRSKKFRLGVRLSSGSLNGMRVREAKTDAFFVKDHRGHVYKKHYPPNLSDDVWRLEKIGKDGAYHERLCEYNVNTVEDFLVSYSIGPSKLREIFGKTMSTKTWDSIIEHAKTCVLNETQHVYYPDSARTIGVIMNTIYQPLGIVRNGSYLPASSLSDTEQVNMDNLVQEAYNNRSRLHKLPAIASYKEPDVATSGLGGLTREACNGLSQGVSETQQFPAQRTVHDTFENNGATREACNALSQAGVTEIQHFHQQRTVHDIFENGGATHEACNGLSQAGVSEIQHFRVQRTVLNSFENSDASFDNMLRSDTAPSMIDLRMKPSLFTDAFSPGTLESIFTQHCPRDNQPVGDDLALYGSHSRYGEDYNNGRNFNHWNDELYMLPGVSTRSFSTATIPDDLQYTSQRLVNARNSYVNESSLHQRPLMGWTKLQVVLKCSYFMKKFASECSIQIEKLN